MAVDKLVDSAQLDACLTAEANAIRAKTGGSANLTFDFANSKGFADAIAAIASGGGEAYELHSVQITLASSTSMVSILNTYIKECSSWRIYPTDAENTALHTIAQGMAFINTGGASIISPAIMPSVRTVTGVTVGSTVGQLYVNDQTYNAIRQRGNVNNKPAGAYQLDFYGVAV